MQEEKTLADLQVGDSVIVWSCGWDWTRRVAKVERVHKLHLIVEGRKYRKGSGRLVGASDYSRESIAVATPERIEDVRREKRRRYVLTTEWKNATDEEILLLVPIAKAIKERST